MHLDGDLLLSRGVPDLSLGVVGESCSVGVPFVLCEALVVIGIDYGVLVLGERDSSKGIAEAEASPN